MREIGGEFWDVPVIEEINTLFPDSAQWFLAGRSALAAIIKDIKSKREVHTVAMPSWCCDSMIIPFLREDIEVRFYPVYWKNGLRQEPKQDSDILFLMDYFGYTSDTSVSHPCVIRDITHSVFSHQYTDASYCFGSLRKWCGVKSGGFAWGIQTEKAGADKKFTDLRTAAMHEKEEYITRRTGSKNYLKIYEEAEEYLDNLEGVFEADTDDIEVIRHLDISRIRSKRRENACILMRELKERLIFPSISTEDCPMFVPVLVPNEKRDSLRGYLIQHDIYCPVHWPVSEYHKLEERELNIYQNELSIICDQRYIEEDIYRIVDTINKFWKEG